jgi:hypothetical protein
VQEGDGAVVCYVLAVRLCNSVSRPSSGWDNGRAERDAATTRGDAKLRDGRCVRNARLDPREPSYGARELTEKALEGGEYKLPKNPEKLATFKELDEQFHDELEKLLTVATSKDGAATGIQVGVVLSKCSGCHAQFRP